jgi:hypothetical protein
VHFITERTNFSFDVGGGNTWIVGGQHGQLNGGPNFQIGGGYNFSRRFSLLAEFMNHDLGIDHSVIQAHGVSDGTADLWSVTLNPKWSFAISGPVGGYLIGGGGFYRLNEKFTVPAGDVVVFDPFVGGVLVPANRVVESDHTAAGGVNGGLGLTFDLGRSGVQFFAEARYHHAFTHPTTQLLPLTFGLRF